MRFHRSARSRMGVLLVVLALMATTGCGSDAATSKGGTTTAPRSDAAATRTVETDLGTVEVPVDPQRILALDEYAAMNAMTFGIEPIEVWASYQSDVAGELLSDAGIEVKPASVEGGVNLEAAAAAKPDLIIMTAEIALEGTLDELTQIAPTLVLPYARPWREVIATSATAFDREEQGEAVIAALEGRIDALATAVEEDAPSISVLADTMGMLFAMSMEAPLSRLLDEVGFTRPPAQADGKADPTYDSAVMISEEVLGDHDADLVIVLEGAYYRSQTFLDSPTFRALPAVEDGRSFVVDGDMWAGSYPFAISWILDDVEALVDGTAPDGIGAMADLADRWDAFEELVG